MTINKPKSAKIKDYPDFEKLIKTIHKESPRTSWIQSIIKLIKSWKTIF